MYKHTTRGIFTLIILFLQVYSLSAQSSYYQDEEDVFTGGVIAGLNLAQVDGDLYFGYTKPGLVAGFFVQIQVRKQLKVGFELLYSQKGSIGDAEVESLYLGSYTARCHIGLNYVSVPVTVKYQLPAFELEGGFAYARLIKTNEWIVATPSVAIDEDKNRFNKSDINGIIGVSREVYNNISVGIRYQYSLMSIRPIERVPAGYGFGSSGQLNNLFSCRVMCRL